MNNQESKDLDPQDASDAVGIVVQSRLHEEQRPRVAAFFWGERVQRGPSLPYGRWKSGVRPAA